MPDTIEVVYDDINAVPEAFRPLYEEQDGKAVLSRVNGLKTQKDIDSLSEALRKERDDHKQAKEALKPWKDKDPEEIQQKLDRIAELEAAAGGKLDDEAINKIVESRIEQKTGPLSRQLEGLTTERDEWKGKFEGLFQEVIKRDRNDAVRVAATELKAHSTAIPDIEMAASVYLEQNEQGKFITKAGIDGITPGLDVKGFLKEMMRQRPHWWPESQGGGAGGGLTIPGGGNNPWSNDHWNLTAQGQIMREQGADVAAQLAKAAGTTIGGARPKK